VLTRYHFTAVKCSTLTHCSVTLHRGEVLKLVTTNGSFRKLMRQRVTTSPR